MEAYESFVALAMETEGLVVSEAVKFPVKRQTKKTSHKEVQTHGFEVDLVGARVDKLVLATVKSFFGSQGVKAAEVTGTAAANTGLYALLNNPVVQDQVLARACQRYGYQASQVEFRLYVGRFAAAKTNGHEPLIREWCAKQMAGGGPIKVFDAREVALVARSLAESKTYRDNPALVAMKVLAEAEMLTPLPSSGA